MDYFLGASAFLSTAAGAGVALFVASVLTASLVAFFSSFLAGAGAAVVAGAGAVTAGAGAAALASSFLAAGAWANAVAANMVATSADTNFIKFPLSFYTHIIVCIHI
jgi:hypothetical protein